MNLKFGLSYGRKIKKVLRKILLIRSSNLRKFLLISEKQTFLIKKKRVSFCKLYKLINCVMDNKKKYMLRFLQVGKLSLHRTISTMTTMTINYDSRKGT